MNEIRAIIALMAIGMVAFFLLHGQSELPKPNPSIPPLRTVEKVYRDVGKQPFPYLEEKITLDVRDQALLARSNLKAFLARDPTAAGACQPAITLCDEIIGLAEKRNRYIQQLESQRSRFTPTLLAKNESDRKQIDLQRMQKIEKPIVDRWLSEMDGFRKRADFLIEHMKVGEATWTAQQDATANFQRSSRQLSQ